MDAPICRFVREYASGGAVRLHMPGHKGRGALGCESVDITEIRGADDLSCPEGVIAESERNTTSLFGSGHTFYSTGGSSQCVKAMLLLRRAALQKPRSPGRAQRSQELYPRLCPAGLAPGVAVPGEQRGLALRLPGDAGGRQGSCLRHGGAAVCSLHNFS